MNYTYIVKCADGTLYCGWTNHLPERIAAHNSGKGAKYTKNRRPVTLVYSEAFETKEEALRREAAIKRLSRAEKLALIARGGEAAAGERADGECAAGEPAAGAETAFSPCKSRPPLL